MSDFEVCPIGTLQRLVQVEAEREALLADMEAIRDCTLLDAEGPELRAQNECNHRRAVQAIARTKGGCGNG